MEFRNAVKYLRKELGLTQIELATALHVTPLTIGRWEKGQNLPNRSLTAVIMNFAHIRGASEKCIKILKDSIANVGKEKLSQTGVDIIPDEQSYKQLQEQESRIEEILNTTPSGIAVIELESDNIAGSIHTVFCNDRFFSFSGYSREEYVRLMQENETQLMFEEDVPQFIDAVRRMIAGGVGATTDWTVRCHTKDGGYRWLLLTGEITGINEKKFTVNVAIVDITEKKNEEDRRRISEEMLRVSTETDNRAIVIYNVKSKLLKNQPFI